MNRPLVVLATVLLTTGCAATSGAGVTPTTTVTERGPATTTPTAAPTPAPPPGADPVLAAAAPELTGSYTLSAPADFGPCPNASDVLSAATGTRVVYWQGELPRAPQGCQWADVDTVTTQTLVEQRYSVSIGFYTGDPALALQNALVGGDPACTSSAEPLGVPMTAASRCTSVSTDGDGGTGDTTWSYLVADAGGIGVWILSVTVGSDYPGDADQLASVGLAGVVRVAASAYGPR